MRKKTKQIYAASLLELLKTSSYDVITISEICDNSTLTRRTFYNNFKSKDDLARYICDDLMDEYNVIMHQKRTYTMRSSCILFFIFGSERHEKFLTLIHNGLFHCFVDAFSRNIKYVSSHIPNNALDSVDETARNYTFLFHAAGVTKLFEEWLLSGMVQSAEEMSDIYLSIIQDVQSV